MAGFFGFNVNCNLQILEESLHTTLSIIGYPYQTIRFISRLQTTTQSFFDLLIESRIPVEYLVKLKTYILYPHSIFSISSHLDLPSEYIFNIYTDLLFPYNFFSSYSHIFFPYYIFNTTTNLLISDECLFSSIVFLQSPNNSLFFWNTRIYLP